MKTTTIAPTDRYEIRPPFSVPLGGFPAGPRAALPRRHRQAQCHRWHILKRCDGSTSVVELIEQLGCDYNASAIDAIRAGVLNFLEVSHAKGWIRAKA